MPDLIAFMRPTYNCGGELVIRFQRTSSKIEVRYTHMAIHRTAASKPVRWAPESLYTFQVKSMSGRGTLGAAKDSRAEPRASGLQMHLNEPASQVAAESQDVIDNADPNPGIIEEQHGSLHPSFRSSDAEPPNDSTHSETVGSRKRKQRSSSELVVS